MNILAIETTGAAASAALRRADGRMFKVVSGDVMSHLQKLLPMVEEALREAGISKKELSVIAVSVGPGSFTGIRIGMAAAKTLAQALNLPVAAVPTLESFVYGEDAGYVSGADGADRSGCDSWANGENYAGGSDNAAKIPENEKLILNNSPVLICPMLDARRNQVYAGAFVKDIFEKKMAAEGLCADIQGHNRTENGNIELIRSDPYDVGEFLNLALEKAASAGIKTIKCFGDGTEHYEDVVLRAVQKEAEQGVTVEIAPVSQRHQSAVYVAEMAFEMAKRDRLSGYHEVKPIYLKKAEAERKLAAGTLRKKKRDDEPEMVYELPPEDEKITYRWCGQSDSEEFARLDALCFPNPWKTEFFIDEFQGGKEAIYCAALNSKNEIIGFAGMVYILDEGEVNRVAVHPLYRSRSIAGHMMNMLISEAGKRGVTNMTLEVREANRSAIALYKNCGFKVESKRIGYYAYTGEDALIMRRKQ